MSKKFSKVYKIWAKIRDIFLPILLLWAFVIAPNLHKTNGMQEIAKSLIFMLCLSIFIMLPLFFIQKKIMQKMVRQSGNDLANYKLNQTISTKNGLLIIGSIMAGLIGFVLLFNLTEFVSNWLIQQLF